jgi:hypothetical protein
MIIFLRAAMGRSSVKWDLRLNQPLKFIKTSLNPFCGMSAWNWELVDAKSPTGPFAYYCLYSRYDKFATQRRGAIETEIVSEKEPLLPGQFL